MPGDGDARRHFWEVGVLKARHDGSQEPLTQSAVGCASGSSSAVADGVQLVIKQIFVGIHVFCSRVDMFDEAGFVQYAEEEMC